MKKNLLALTLCAAVALSVTGCATSGTPAVTLATGTIGTPGQTTVWQKVEAFFSTQQAKINAWWESPTTQAGVKIAADALESGLLNLGINVGEQALTGEKITWTADAWSAGSAAARSMELTPSAGDAGAITSTILAAVKDPAQATVIASQVVSSVKAATDNGADPSGALEGAAQALDSAAATVAANTPAVNTTPGATVKGNPAGN